MVQLLDLIEERLVDILENARGSSSLGTDALARYIQLGRYRRSSYAVSLDDSAFPAVDFDRGYEIEWPGVGQDPDPQNPLDGTELVALPCELSIGFAFGKEIPQFISATGTEIAADAATFYSRRAVSDMHRILRAITFPAIVAGDLGGSITLVECVRRKGTASTTRTVGPGRAVGTISLDLLVEIPTDTSYDP